MPVHKHLLDQKFMVYVEARRKLGKPLFYDPVRARGGKGANPQWQKVAERLGEWVRETLKITDVQQPTTAGAISGARSYAARR